MAGERGRRQRPKVAADYPMITGMAKASSGKAAVRRPVDSGTPLSVSSQMLVMRRKTCQKTGAQSPASTSGSPVFDRAAMVRAVRWKAGAPATWRRQNVCPSQVLNELVSALPIDGCGPHRSSRGAAPGFGERAVINRVEPEIVVESGDESDSVGIVAGDDECLPVCVTAWPRESQESGDAFVGHAAGIRS